MADKYDAILAGVGALLFAGAVIPGLPVLATAVPAAGLVGYGMFVVAPA